MDLTSSNNLRMVHGIHHIPYHLDQETKVDDSCHDLVIDLLPSLNDALSPLLT